MKKKPDSLIYVVVLFGLIIAAVITTSIINAVKNNQSSSDIRARAGMVNIIKLTGTVSEVNATNGTITVANVQFSPKTRSGPAVNYGTWTVTPPLRVNISTLTPGKTVSFVVNSASFDVATRNVTASQLTVNR